MKVINSQLSPVSYKDIEDIVFQYPQKDKELVLNITKKLTQFGNINSLNTISDNIGKICKDSYSKNTKLVPYIHENNDSTASILLYLKNKNSIESLREVIGTNKAGHLLIDETTIKELENNNDLFCKRYSSIFYT